MEHENPTLDVLGHSPGIRENPKLLINKGESTKCLRLGADHLVVAIKVL